MQQKGIKISNKEYRTMRGVSSTDLKKMVRSPAHYKYWKEHPECNDTPALIFGKAAHKYVLETYDFYNEFAIAPVCDRRTKDGKSTYEMFLKESEGKDVITLEQFEQIDAMRKALYSTEFVADLLSGEKELSFFTVDDDTLLPLKCRPDCLSIVKGTNILIDYKTCTDAENMRFYRDSVKLNYDLQMAYYLDILKKVTGEDFLVVILAQEKSAPYAVNVFELSEQYLESGREVYREMLKVYAECDKSGNWYGYMKNGISTLGMPDDDLENEESEE